MGRRRPDKVVVKRDDARTVGIVPDRERAAAVAAATAVDCGLSPRETEVLVATARGCCTKEIALALGLSAKTIEYFWTRIFVKLRCRSQIEAMSLLLERSAQRARNSRPKELPRLPLSMPIAIVPPDGSSGWRSRKEKPGG